jgi:hypothetical protein
MKKKVEKIVYKKIDDNEELEKKRQAILALAIGVYTLLYVYKTFHNKRKF